MIGIFVHIAVGITSFFIFTSSKFMYKQGIFPSEKKKYFNIVVVICAFISAVSFIIVDAIVAHALSPTEVIKSCEIINSQEIVSVKDSSSEEETYFYVSGNGADVSDYVCFIPGEHGLQNITIHGETVHPVYVKYISEKEEPRVDQYGVVKRTILKSKPSIWGSIINYFGYKNTAVGTVVSEEIVDEPDFLNIYVNVSTSSTDKFDDYRYEICVPEGAKTGTVIGDFN